MFPYYQWVDLREHRKFHDFFHELWDFPVIYHRSMDKDGASFQLANGSSLPEGTWPWPRVFGSTSLWGGRQDLGLPKGCDSWGDGANMERHGNDHANDKIIYKLIGC